VKEGLFGVLQRLQILEVDVLELDVALGDIVRTTRGDIARRGDELLVRTDSPSHVHYVAMEIRKLLKLPNALSDTISLILISPTMADAEDFLQVRNISSLPPEEAAALAGRSPDLLSEEDPDEVVDASEEDTSAELGLPGDPEAPPLQTNSTPAQSPRLEVSEPTGAAAALVETKPPTGAIAEETREAGAREEPDVSGSPSRAPEEHFDRSRQVDSGSPGGSSGFRPTGVVGAPSGSRLHRQPGRSRPMRTRKGRLLSYAEPGVGPTEVERETDPAVAKRKAIIEKAAVKFFLEMASHHWARLKEMPHDNPGFDVAAVAHDGTEEFIEVKGQSGAWTEEGVALSPNELITAHRFRDSYWLCVVEYAADESRRRLFLVRNPFGLTNQFRFDVGWKSVASTLAGRPERPEPGMFVVVEGEGKALISAVKGSPNFARLHLEFEDGRKAFGRIFNPARMTLSYE
jgi:hypothetical protein